MKNKIKVVIKRPQEKAFVAEIDKGLASLQNFVDGLIECVELPHLKNVDIILNEEANCWVCLSISFCRSIGMSWRGQLSLSVLILDRAIISALRTNRSNKRNAISNIQV